MALILIDTNVWARRLESSSPFHPVARQAIATLKARGDEPVIVPQTLYELWVVATRPATARGGLGYAPEEAKRVMAAICRVGRVYHDNAAILPEWQRLVAMHKVSGVGAHDARLVAAMRIHSIAQILTFNTADFVRYASEGITPIAPTSV